MWAQYNGLYYFTCLHMCVHIINNILLCDEHYVVYWQQQQKKAQVAWFVSFFLLKTIYYCPMYCVCVWGARWRQIHSHMYNTMNKSNMKNKCLGIIELNSNNNNIVTKRILLSCCWAFFSGNLPTTALYICLPFRPNQYWIKFRQTMAYKMF